MLDHGSKFELAECILLRVYTEEKLVKEKRKENVDSKSLQSSRVFGSV
jgi:hypothetical protein